MAQLTRKLSEVVRACIEECQSAGEYTVQDVTELTLSRYGDIVKEAATQLIRAAVTNIARKMMKNTRFKGDGQTELFLPDELAGLRLAEAICYLKPGANEDDPDCYVWIALCHAQYWMVLKYMEILRTSILRDQRRLNEMALLKSFLSRYIDADSEEAIGKILARIAQERKQEAA